MLLIITDGAISDMPDTKEAIIDAASSAALSIIIVGVGCGFRLVGVRSDSDINRRSERGSADTSWSGERDSVDSIAARVPPAPQRHT